MIYYYTFYSKELKTVLMYWILASQEQLLCHSVLISSLYTNNRDSLVRFFFKFFHSRSF
jgi:hypothetical protein